MDVLLGHDVGDEFGDDVLLGDEFGSSGDQEIVGDEFGDDDFGEIGAAVPRNVVARAQAILRAAQLSNAKARAARMERARAVDPNAVAVRTRRLDRRRRFPCGFDAKTVAASATDTAFSAPQFLFRPERIVVPSDIAFDLRVLDVKVGQTSQLVSGAPLPAAIFSEVAIDTNVSFRTAEIGNQIQLQLQNTTAAPVGFSAALIGTVAV
jgi:hypothetical protein